MARRWRRFASPWLLAATFVLAACGVSTPSAAPTTRPNLPNGPIDIGGGRHLNITCGGTGDKVVILDAGLGNTSAVWTSVVRLVQPFATVCSYDRAGMGASDSRPLPHGAESAVDDLHALLVAGKLPGPYILVGASFGGLDVQIFARRFPTETAGVVLVDSLGTGWDPRLEAILSPAQVTERQAIPNGEEITNEEIRASEVAAGAGPAFPNVPPRPPAAGQRDLGDGGCAIWSPDSTRLAMCRADGTVIVVAVADGSRTTILTGPGAFEPTAWSPDGATIALFGTQDGTGEIYLVDVGGAHLRRLTTAPGNQSADLWIVAGLIVTSSLPGADVSDWFLVDPVSGVPSVIPWMRGLPNPIADVPPR